MSRFFPRVTDSDSDEISFPEGDGGLYTDASDQDSDSDSDKSLEEWNKNRKTPTEYQPWDILTPVSSGDEESDAEQMTEDDTTSPDLGQSAREEEEMPIPPEEIQNYRDAQEKHLAECLQEGLHDFAIEKKVMREIKKYMTNNPDVVRASFGTHRDIAATLRGSDFKVKDIADLTRDQQRYRRAIIDRLYKKIYEH
jgi:hypothetical protein